MQTIISIHGIKTRGKWQKEITPLLGGFRHTPLDFGNFLALQLARSKPRQQQIEWFLEEYTKISADSSRPSVIAHSFGTYIVAKAMERYPEIVFDRIIFCGSIAPPSFNWGACEEQFNALLNDCGKRDFWSLIARAFVEDAGPSGVNGFSDTANGKVENRIHENFRHSDYFYKLNYTKQWIPFLRGEKVQPLTARDKPPTNWLFWAIRTLIIAIACLLLFWCGRLTYCHDWPWDPIPGPSGHPSIQTDKLPPKESVFKEPAFAPEKVKLTLVNETGKNIVVLMYACEFSFPETQAQTHSSGWYQSYLLSGGSDYIENFPAQHGWHYFLVKGKCDPEPIAIRALDIFGGRYPIVHIETGGDNEYKVTLEYDREVSN